MTWWTSDSITNKSSSMETEKFTVEKLEFRIPDYRPICVKSLDDQNIAVVLKNESSGNIDPESKERVYVYNLISKKHSLIFEGKFLGYVWSARLKVTTLGSNLIEGNNSALEIDKESFKSKGLISKGSSFESDLSHDLSRIIYHQEGGLYLGDSNSPSSKDTVLYKYDRNKKQPVATRISTKPLWSFDDRSISYLLINASDETANKVVFLDPITKKQKTFTVSNLVSGWWFNDNKRFVAYTTGAVIGEIPKITVIDTSNDQVQEYEKTGNIEIESPPYGDQVLYLQQDATIPPNSSYPLGRLVAFNVVTNTSDIVTPDFLNITSSSFSASGKDIFFIGNLTPGEELRIYMAHKIE